MSKVWKFLKFKVHVVSILHPKGGHVGTSATGDSEWKAQALFGASLRLVTLNWFGVEALGYWLHFRFPIWFATKTSRGMNCYPVATFTVFRPTRITGDTWKPFDPKRTETLCWKLGNW